MALPYVYPVWAAQYMLFKDFKKLLIHMKIMFFEQLTQANETALMHNNEKTLSSTMI